MLRGDRARSASRHAALIMALAGVDDTPEFAYAVASIAFADAHIIFFFFLHDC